MRLRYHYLDPHFLSSAASQELMKDFYICDCATVENQTITSLFVVAVKQVKSKKNGELYLSLVLADRSGQLQANMWDNVGDALTGFDQDDFVKVKGIIHKYNGRWQLTVHKVRRLGDTEIDYTDYLPKTPKDVDELWRTVGRYVDGFQNHWLKSLLQSFMADDALVAAYKAAPAAKTLHHAFVGGLLDHVVSLFNLADLTSRNYPQIDRDLLLTGVFLHDIGKLHELTYQRSIAYTTKGQLLGHMIIELEMLHEKIAGIPGFPDELKILIEHMIISHHGQYEFGSPKLPMFPEALMLHYLDDLDSKMESMRAQFERESELETAWTSYNPSLARPLLNTKKFLEKGLTVSRMESPRPPMATSVAPTATAESATGTDNDFAPDPEPAQPVASPTESPNSAPPPSTRPQLAATQPTSASNPPPAAPKQASAPETEDDRPSSPLEALQRKFELHKVTPVTTKSH